MAPVKRSLEARPAPEHMVFSSDGSRIYVTNPRAGTVSQVSLATGKVERALISARASMALI